MTIKNYYRVYGIHFTDWNKLKKFCKKHQVSLYNKYVQVYFKDTWTPCCEVWPNAL